jgi:hypothetical protein
MKQLPISFVSKEGRVVEPSRAHFKQKKDLPDAHDVPYHGRLPLVVPGAVRAVAKIAHGGGYVALRIRTTDKEPDVRLLEAISKNQGIELMFIGRGNSLPSTADSPACQMPVKIRLENGYYEVSASGVPHHEMDGAMRMVDSVGRALLLNKEIGQDVEGRDSVLLLERLTKKF